jgi:hypothetical protein
MHERTAFGHRPFVSGVMTAEVISELFEPKEEGWAVTFRTKREDNCDGANWPSLGLSCLTTGHASEQKRRSLSLSCPTYTVQQLLYSGYRLLSLIPPHRFLRRPSGRLGRLVTIIPFYNTPPTGPSYARSSWQSI